MLKIRKMVVMLSMLFLISCGYPPLTVDVEVPSDYTYIIGPGDSLEIFVWDNPDISKTVTVRPDGKITTPLVEDLMASDKTPAQLADDLEASMSKYVRDPLVAVIVNNFQGIYHQQVRIIGQLSGGGGGSTSSGSSGSSGSTGSSGSSSRGSSGGNSNRYTAKSIPFTKEMTLLDLMIQIGGIGQYGDGNRSSIIRNFSGERQQFGIRIDDLLEDGDLSANVKIFPGDILIIPEAFF